MAESTRDRIVALLREYPEMTASEAAKQVGVSRQRAHQIFLAIGRTERRSRPLHTVLAVHRKEYQCWINMIDRCSNPKRASWPHYGGRGITVCDRWLNSFRDFLEDMGPRPSPKHSLDRINNNGNYEPRNCRWATQREQIANRRPMPKRDVPKWVQEAQERLDQGEDIAAIAKDLKVARITVYRRLVWKDGKKS